MLCVIHSWIWCLHTHTNMRIPCLQRRADAEVAIQKLNHVNLHDNELQLGWGKSVQLPQKPLYDGTQSAAQIASGVSMHRLRDGTVMPVLQSEKVCERVTRVCGCHECVGKWRGWALSCCRARRCVCRCPECVGE